MARSASGLPTDLPHAATFADHAPAFRAVPDPPDTPPVPAAEVNTQNYQSFTELPSNSILPLSLKAQCTLLSSLKNLVPETMDANNTHHHHILALLRWALAKTRTCAFATFAVGLQQQSTTPRLACLAKVLRQHFSASPPVTRNFLALSTTSPCSTSNSCPSSSSPFCQSNHEAGRNGRLMRSEDLCESCRKHDRCYLPVSMEVTSHAMIMSLQLTWHDSLNVQPVQVLISIPAACWESITEAASKKSLTWLRGNAKATM